MIQMIVCVTIGGGEKVERHEMAEQHLAHRKKTSMLQRLIIPSFEPGGFCGWVTLSSHQ
jgi:hypothetical protein